MLQMCFSPWLYFRVKSLLSSLAELSPYIEKQQHICRARCEVKKCNISFGLESGDVKQEGKSQMQRVLDKKKFFHPPDFLWRFSHLPIVISDSLKV